MVIRLRELKITVDKLNLTAPVNWAKTQELILKELNIAVSKERKGKFELNPAAIAGANAGAHARFDRPVSSGGTLRLK